MESHVYETVPVQRLANTTVSKTEEELDGQKGQTTQQGHTLERRHIADHRPMLPTAKGMPTPSITTTPNPGGVYMSLNRREELQNQYMSLCAATEITQSNVGPSAWRRVAQENQDTAHLRAERESPEKLVYMNQVKHPN